MLKFIIIYLYNIFNSHRCKDSLQKCGICTINSPQGEEKVDFSRDAGATAGEKRYYASSVLHLGLQGEPV